MQAVENKLTNGSVGKPVLWGEQLGPCIGLPVCIVIDPAQFYSWWKLSLRERIAVLLGKPIRLCIAGNRHPAVSLDVTAC
jgi:hypothetical protein